MNLAVSEPLLIGIDWGTSSFRAFLIGAEGQVIDCVSSSEGIMQRAGHSFEDIFNRHIGPWIVGRHLPIIASGMITSRNGWVETPYAELPLGAEDLAHQLLPHRTMTGASVHFVTGAAIKHAGAPDVMRGEETQIVGASAFGLNDGIFVMPGTHSKWVTVTKDKIIDFSTYMTGEVFAVLKQHSILGALMDTGDFNAGAFEAGVAAGRESGANLLHKLFHVRTLPLMGIFGQDETADYLSGLLIGTEVLAATQNAGNTGTITIVGRNDLSDRYEIALRIAGLKSRRAPDDIVVKGHFRIAKAAGLLG